MTSGTLEKRLEDARTGTRELSNRQIFNLAYRNVKLKAGLAPKRRRKGAGKDQAKK